MYSFSCCSCNPFSFSFLSSLHLIVFCFRSPSPSLSLSWAKLPGQSLNLNFRIDVIHNAHMIYLLIQMGAGHTNMPRPLPRATLDKQLEGIAAETCK